MRPDLLVEVEAVAGTGKTTLFRRLLEARDGPRDGRLVLTFINNLRGRPRGGARRRARWARAPLEFSARLTQTSTSAHRIARRG